MTALRDLSKVFTVLAPDLTLHPREAGPELYQSLDEDFDQFRGHVLIAEHAFANDWPTWEMHPAGDELVVLLEGACTFLLRIDGTDQALELGKSGEYAIVPQGVWHTAKVTTSTRMLFITPGEGTENRETPA
ncbi:MAG: cupin [Pseudomonadota bacterium]